MMKYLKTKKFIGDLSLEDADVLVQYALNSKSILEFGSGGSTQLFSQCGCQEVLSVETDPQWVSLTGSRISKIQNSSEVTFLEYSQTPTDKKFDLIFVDGVDHLRREFAIQTWNYLNDSGVMIFHDTRRFNDFQNAAWIAQLYHNQISKISINTESESNGKSSNLTILHKKHEAPYVNWNLVEGKPNWAYGDPKYSGDVLSWEKYT